MLRSFRQFAGRHWWVAAPSIPGVPGEPPVEPGNTAPIVANIIPDQQATEGTLFNFTFAANTFSDIDLDVLTYTATLAGGTPLPSWLTFTPSTRTFSGTPPSVIAMSITVTANDGLGGIVSDTFVLDVIAADVDVPLLTLSDGNDLVTASYNSITNERNKPPVIEEVDITGLLEVGATLTATITGHTQGPFTIGVHEYQWYTATEVMDAVLTPIVGATSNTYVIQSGDYGKFLTCRARFIQLEGSNNTSDYMYAELTSEVTSAPVQGDGDIDHAWADFFDIESGASVPANWNDAGVSPTLINLGTGANWTTVEATKPSFNVNRLVFANAHKITGYSSTHPPVFEVWMKARFTGGAGNILSMGNQTLFGVNSSGQYVSNGLTPQAGDTTEHIFRLVFKGTNSIFQFDGGPEISFDENTSVGSLLILGQNNNASSPGDFEIKRLQRTNDGVQLTAQEVIDKWLFHGFVVSGGGNDISYAWEDFFDIETGASVPANWNDAGVSPSLINLGTGGDWTTVEATKPTFSSDKLVFANAHRVQGPTGNTVFPPVYEVWIKARFTGGAGNILSQGNQLIFGNNSSNQYTSSGLTPQAGDLTEHVFRIVLSGLNSIFQVDGGAEVIFDESTTSGTQLIMGQTNSGASAGDFEIKRFQRTPDGSVLSAQEVLDKWAYHGF